MTPTEQFADTVRAYATKAGYDLSSPRSGGRSQLAADTGMSPSSIGRMLSGQTTPAAENFERLAKAINVSLGHLLEVGGIVSPGALTGKQPPTT